MVYNLWSRYSKEINLKSSGPDPKPSSGYLKPHKEANSGFEKTIQYLLKSKIGILREREIERSALTSSSALCTLL